MTERADRGGRLLRTLLIAIPAIVIAAVLLLTGYVWGRAHAVPFPTQFWQLAAQPLATFGAGVFALLAGAAALAGAHLISSRGQGDTTREIAQRQQAAEADVEQRRRAAGSTELWKRFEWVADHVSEVEDVEPLIDEEQAATMVVSIRDAARDLGDEHLFTMLNAYMGEQLVLLAAEIDV